MLQIPYNAKTIEIRGSIIWFDEDGILYSKPKPIVPVDVTDDEIRLEMKRFREIVGYKKVCMIAEAAGGGRPPKREQRQLLANEVASVTKALAVLVNSPLTKMIITLFYTFAPPPYPVKMFKNAQEAKKWIRQYL